jgi:hypothetical protein
MLFQLVSADSTSFANKLEFFAVAVTICLNSE